jgi:hypothetical protein
MSTDDHKTDPARKPHRAETEANVNAERTS